jgi:hypothetical protein
MATKGSAAKQVEITAPNMREAHFRLIGIAPYVQLRFGEKAINAMKENMMAGSQAKKGKKKEPRDFDEDYRQACHISTEGWHGVPASAFRNALISACRLVGFQMTKAKLGVFVEADGVDVIDGTPLVKIEGTPEHVEHYARNANGGTDIRVRAMWREWSLVLRVRFDADMFSLKDIANLLNRVGAQVGIGEGRPDSKQSAGMGWGMFTITGGDQ